MGTREGGNGLLHFKLPVNSEGGRCRQSIMEVGGEIAGGVGVYLGVKGTGGVSRFGHQLKGGEKKVSAPEENMGSNGSFAIWGLWAEKYKGWRHGNWERRRPGRDEGKVGGGGTKKTKRKRGQAITIVENGRAVETAHTLGKDGCLMCFLEWGKNNRDLE